MPTVIVDVAATTPFELVFEMGGNVPRYDASWDELPRASVEIDSSKSLRDVMRLACDQLSVRLTADVIAGNARYREEEGLPPGSSHAADSLVYVDFWRPGDDDVMDGSTEPPILGRHARRPTIDVAVRDTEGRAVWRRPGLDASLAELMDAAHVGLVEGDPLRPYLHPTIPQGDVGSLSEWLTFANALKAIGATYLAMNAASAAEGTIALLQRVRRRGQQAQDAANAVEANATAWTDRGAAPGDLLQMLARRPRTTDEVAGLLGCDSAEAEAILWGLGFEYAADRALWRHAGDPISKLLADDIDLSFFGTAGVHDPDTLFRVVLEARLEEFVATGVAPDRAEGEARLRAAQFEAFTQPRGRPRNLVRRLRRIVGR